MSGPFGSSQWMYKSGDYEIDNSLRFNPSESAYLSRTPSAGNRKTWTFSTWIKRGNLGIDIDLLHAYADSGERSQLVFAADDTIKFDFDDYTANRLTTTQSFRDASAWYHIVLAVDTTQGTAANRVKIYVNGNQITAFSAASYPSENEDGHINSAIQHEISSYDGSGSYLDGYLAEVNFIEGTALDASYFGETGDYGEWKPKKYSGAYGNEGFYLDFKSSGVGTASSSTVGADRSGNDNHWTSTNITATDQMLDTPTNNFATLNPLVKTTTVLSEGNLRAAYQQGGDSVAVATMSLTQKSYCEFRNLTNGAGGVGIYADRGENLLWVGVNGDSTGHSMQYRLSGLSYIDGASNGANMAATDGDDILGMAYDPATGKFFLSRNGTFVANNAGGAGNPATGANPFFTIDGPYEAFFAFGMDETSGGVMNFGQDSSFAGNNTAQGNTDGKGQGDFFYEPPSGYLALCTKNLPEPAVIPSKHFNTILYTGNDNDNHAITGVGFQPDFLWIKNRGTTDIHELVDAARGQFSGGNGLGRLRSNDTTAEIDSTIEGFTADGFTLDGDNTGYNGDGGNYVAWNWKANGSGSSNTNGSIDSTKTSANVDAGFSIVSFTGTNDNGATIGHGLSKAPEMLIVKARSASGENWRVYHSGLANYGTDAETDVINLNLTDAVSDAASIWNDTAPTSSVFSVGEDGGVNADGTTYVAYCFHSVDGHLDVGSYIGNGNAEGTFVHTGFRVAMVIRKRIDDTTHWHINDNARIGFNGAGSNLSLRPNVVDDEDDADRIDLLSNGFKVRTTSGDANNNNSPFIYIAFAETPFKYSNAR